MVPGPSGEPTELGHSSEPTSTNAVFQAQGAAHDNLGMRPTWPHALVFCVECHFRSEAFVFYLSILAMPSMQWTHCAAYPCIGCRLLTLRPSSLVLCLVNLLDILSLRLSQIVGLCRLLFSSCCLGRPPWTHRLLTQMPSSPCLTLAKSCFPRPLLPKNNKSLRVDNKIIREFIPSPIMLSNIL